MKFLYKEESDTHIIYVLFGIKIKIKKVYKNNKIYLVDKNGNKKLVKKVDGLEIVFKGANNTIEIGCNPVPLFKNSKIILGNNSCVQIGHSKYIIESLNIVVNLLLINDKLSRIIIGDDFSIRSGYLKSEEGISLIIGNDCMFATNIYVRNTDGHTLYDVNTVQPINKSSDIVIGNHVWLAKNVAVLKGSVIPDNTVVGFGGIYTQSINKIASENTVLAGNPLRVIKRNINWDREDVQSFNRNNNPQTLAGADRE